VKRPCCSVADVRQQPATGQQDRRKCVDQPAVAQLLPATLEIRGSPPRLWVERHGGEQGNLYSDIPVTPSSVPVRLRLVLRPVD
jgi:hypothetical protein